MAKFPLIDRPALVYQATNRTNGKKYIGATTIGVNARRKSHMYAAKAGINNGAFHRAIRKYGIDVFDWTVLSHHRTAHEAAKEEHRIISSERPEYNSTPGGLGFHKRTWSEADKKRMSELKKGVPTGRHIPMPMWLREHLRTINTGRQGHWKGKKLPDHVGPMISARMAKRKDKERVLPLGPKSMQKKTVCLDDGRIFDSASAAALFYGVDSSQLIAVCNKRRKRISGMIFRYCNDLFEAQEEINKVNKSVHESQIATAKNARKNVYDAVRRPIVCIDDGMTFPSIKSAAEFYGARADAISNVCSGVSGYKSAKGRKFAYLQKNAGKV